MLCMNIAVNDDHAVSIEDEIFHRFFRRGSPCSPLSSGSLHVHPMKMFKAERDFTFIDTDRNNENFEIGKFFKFFQSRFDFSLNK